MGYIKPDGPHGWDFGLLGPLTTVQNITCNNEGKNSDKKKYSLAMADVGFELLDLDGDGVAETPSFPVYQVVMETENMNYGYDIRGFTLSDNEAANFDNTDLIPTSLPFNLTDDAGNVIFAIKDELNETETAALNVHCHYAPRDEGMFRTFTYQHDLERDYPIKRHLHRQCFCDWTKLGTPVPKKRKQKKQPGIPKLITSCDCTRNAGANGGCNKRDGQNLYGKTGVVCNQGQCGNFNPNNFN